MTARVNLAALQLGPLLDRGGQGSVFRVLDRADDQGRPLVYKQYNPELIAQLNTAALDQLVDLPLNSTELADWLHERTAWPQALVEDQGNVVGFLMRVIPERFRFDFQSSPGVSSAKFCQFAFLLNSDGYVRSSGLHVTDQDRLLLLADIAAVLGRFHRMGVAVGDFSPKNLLFSSDGSHRTFFIDCDAMRIDGATVLKQVHTPDWELPAGAEAGTPAGDDYKFGLLAIRLFARSQTARDPSELARVSAYLGQLAHASQDPDPRNRPGASAWLEALLEGARVVGQNQQAASPTQTQAVTAPSSAGTGAPSSGPAPTQPPRPRIGLALGALAGVATLLVGGGLVGHTVYDHLTQTSAVGSPATTTTTDTTDSGSADTAAPPTTAVPATTSSPAPPSSVGVVAIDSAFVNDPRAQQVATMLNTYFSAISDKNYNLALQQFDPSGTMNPNDPQQAQSFEQGVSTSSDSNVALHSLSPAGPATATTADVTLTSSQQAGYGPSGNEDQTCTDWTLTYTLSYINGSYLIYDSKGTYAGC